MALPSLHTSTTIHFALYPPRQSDAPHLRQVRDYSPFQRRVGWDAREGIIGTSSATHEIHSYYCCSPERYVQPQHGGNSIYRLVDTSMYAKGDARGGCGAAPRGPMTIAIRVRAGGADGTAKPQQMREQEERNRLERRSTTGRGAMIRSRRIPEIRVSSLYIDAGRGDHGNPDKSLLRLFSVPQPCRVLYNLQSRPATASSSSLVKGNIWCLQIQRAPAPHPKSGPRRLI
ncbi:hypothetical protein MSAN_01762400 [Mycena sanguinolenta]|uniref:Uncharacterized protein n=1 Tax=Mycena sanguinolenta TaxID=230812 RepID=A0A8H6XV29_9AGAR|nr:hypothetical protein MSAN_01762400 [Mycena sanguinolenta]